MKNCENFYFAMSSDFCSQIFILLDDKMMVADQNLDPKHVQKNYFI